MQVYGDHEGKRVEYGLLYGGGGKLLACQVIGICAIGAWAFVLMATFFKLLDTAGKETNKQE
eukprot:4765961-Pyramimonas_sp.AAC.1